MLGRIRRGTDQEYAKYRVDTDNHLKIVHALAAMPESILTAISC